MWRASISRPTKYLLSRLACGSEQIEESLADVLEHLYRIVDRVREGLALQTLSQLLRVGVPTPAIYVYLCVAEQLVSAFKIRTRGKINL